MDWKRLDVMSDKIKTSNFDSFESVADKIKNVLFEHGITEVAFLDAAELEVINARILNNHNYRTCILFIVPYFNSKSFKSRISKYAIPKDYHIYFRNLFNNIIPKLEAMFPGEVFDGYSDHSPFNEIDAAAKSGLGFIGDNRLLITQKYGSFVFIGEIITTLSVDKSKYLNNLRNQRTECLHCGKCVSACPTGALRSGDFSICLSSVSQKKHKTTEELELLKKHGVVWGCDICQDCCLHNKNITYSNIQFFSEDLLSDVNSEMIKNMSKKEFRTRAFSWRGRTTILETLEYFEKNEFDDREKC